MNPEVETRRRSIARVLWAILWLNLAVAAAKLAYGLWAGALAMTADAFHSLLDAAGNVVGLIAVTAARRPPDANHPYGHRKYETFAALGIGLMLLLGCHEILAAVIERLRQPRVPAISAAGFAIIGATTAVNLGVFLYERRAGRRLRSELLHADATHTGSDILASALVLASFGGAARGWAWVDVACALAIVALIGAAGLRILRGTLSTLSDERRIDPGLVERVALEEPGVLEAHNVRSRGPLDDIHLDLHILVDPALAIASAHALGHRVERRLRDRWPDVTDIVVHVEPGVDQERARVREGGALRAED